LGTTPQSALAAMASVSKGLLSQLNSQAETKIEAEEVKRG
jgi:hypothetical protein